MDKGELDAKKLQGDKLVESYGRLQLATGFREAISNLNSIWGLDPVEFQVFCPKKCLIASNVMSKAVEIATGSGKSFFGSAATTGSLAVAKTPGGLAEKAAAALNQASAAKTLAKSSASTAMIIITKNKKAAAGVGGLAAVTGFVLGNTLKRELQQLNESCYAHYGAQIDKNGDVEAP